MPSFAKFCLTIRTKTGRGERLVLNAAQQRVHDAVEAQRQRTGRVRTVILKARQWGCSTYAEARAFHLTKYTKGARAFILTQAQDASDAIFGIARLFHDDEPPEVRHEVARDNARELVFGEKVRNSGFEIGTAGTRSVGRGRTVQFFHGSEVAFWPNAQEHISGVLQAVPDLPGTEIILESTANGIGDPFYRQCMAALRGIGNYQLIFVPWFWHEEYVTMPPPGWTPPPAWSEYQTHHCVGWDQLYWAYCKNADLAVAVGDPPEEPCWRFRQEYPATVDEAFQTSGDGGFIKPERVLAARRAVLELHEGAALVLGVDVARGGKDKSYIIDRQGRCAGRHVNMALDSDDLMEVAGQVALQIERLRPDQVFIDVTGIGGGVVDRLRERGFKRVVGVNFGSVPAERDRYANKRAEMWARLRDWLGEPGGADIPDDDSLHAQLCAVGATFDSNSALVLEKKEDIRARLGFSPDAADALALTFAERVGVRTTNHFAAAHAHTAYDPFA